MRSIKERNGDPTFATRLHTNTQGDVKTHIIIPLTLGLCGTFLSNHVKDTPGF